MKPSILLPPSNIVGDKKAWSQLTVTVNLEEASSFIGFSQHYGAPKKGGIKIIQGDATIYFYGCQIRERHTLNLQALQELQTTLREPIQHLDERTTLIYEIEQNETIDQIDSIVTEFGLQWVDKEVISIKEFLARSNTAHLYNRGIWLLPKTISRLRKVLKNEYVFLPCSQKKYKKLLLSELARHGR